MLHRYGNIEYVLNLPIKRSSKLIKQAFEEERLENLYRQWLMYLPYMTKDNYMDFNEYCEISAPVEVDTRSTDEIMKELGVINGSVI